MRIKPILSITLFADWMIRKDAIRIGLKGRGGLGGKNKKLVRAWLAMVNFDAFL